MSITKMMDTLIAREISKKRKHSYIHKMYIKILIKSGRDKWLMFSLPKQHRNLLKMSQKYFTLEELVDHNYYLTVDDDSEKKNWVHSFNNHFSNPLCK